MPRANIPTMMSRILLIENPSHSYRLSLVSRDKIYTPSYLLNGSVPRYSN